MGAWSNMKNAWATWPPLAWTSSPRSSRTGSRASSTSPASSTGSSPRLDSPSNPNCPEARPVQPACPLGPAAGSWARTGFTGHAPDVRDRSSCVDGAAAQRGDPAGDGRRVCVWCRRPAFGYTRPGTLAQLLWPGRVEARWARGRARRGSGVRRHLRYRPGGLVALLVSMCILLAFETGAVAAARRGTKIHLADTDGDASPLHSLKPGLVVRRPERAADLLAPSPGEQEHHRYRVRSRRRAGGAATRESARSQ